MPRDNDKNNASSRGRRDRPPGGKGRSGAARGPDKKFPKRAAPGKTFAGRPDNRKRDAAAPRRHDRDAPPRFGKDAARPARFGRDDRPRGDRPDRNSGDRKFSPAAPDRGPRKDFGGRPDRGPDRGGAKPWQKRDASSPDHVGRNSRSRDGARKFDKPRYDKPRDDRGGEARPRFSHPREDRPGGDRPFREPRKFDRPRQDRPKFDRPRQRPEGGAAWQEHPRSDRHADRPRRDNEEDSRIFTKDGGLARALELPDTGWLRRYRVRAHGEVTQGQLDELRKGVEVDGVKYGPIDATLERDQGANVWLVFAIREGKNREVRNVLAHLGLEVNRLIRVSYGPFQLLELAEGVVEEVKTRVLREQLGEKIA